LLDYIPANITIVLPAFNEASAVGDVIRDLRAALPETALLVIDDGSSDGTADAARKAGGEVISHPHNRGYGGTWKTGLSEAKTPFVMFYDADGQFTAEQALALIAQWQESKPALISGARSKSSHVDAVRKPGKMVLGAFSRLLVGQRIPDLNCGLRIYRREQLLSYVELLPNGFSASATSLILYIKQNFEIDFMPVQTRKRVGKSSVSIIKDGFNILLLITRLIALYDPIRLFLIPSFTLAIFGILYSGVVIVSQGLGLPVFGAVALLGALILFFMGILCDQVSAIRIAQARTNAALARLEAGRGITHDPE
jgi:glycosyltransferase involved in cell wall biosynthesis